MSRDLVSRGWNHQEEPDLWDCLYCKLVTPCPYGRAVVKLRDFCRLREACPIREPVEFEGTVSSEVEKCLLEIYGHDALVTTDELAVYMRVHMGWFRAEDNPLA